MSAASVTVSAPAKVNLYLGVAGLRPDGYHAVSTVLQALELADEITVTRSGHLAVECDPSLGIASQENLVYRAAVELGQLVGFEPAFDFRLTKCIPAGAGLGGGSSDAAAALAGMAALLGLDPHDPHLARVARSLGADVAFFLEGGTALYGGRGEKLVRHLPTLAVDVALVKPAGSVSTAAAYAEFDRRGGRIAPGPSTVTDALRRQERASLGAALYNNMTDAASGLVAEIPKAIALCGESDGVLGAALCGSGSAVFALCENEQAARDVVDKAVTHGWWATATRTNSAGVVVNEAEECG